MELGPRQMAGHVDRFKDPTLIQVAAISYLDLLSWSYFQNLIQNHNVSCNVSECI